MGNMSYDDAQFQMKFREYLGNQPVDLGAAATEICPGWFPPGPITLTKVGLFVAEAFSGSAFTVTFYKEEAGSVIATIACSTTSIVLHAIGSKTPTITSIDHNECIRAGSDGTGDTGQVIAFVDYVRTFDTYWAV